MIEIMWFEKLKIFGLLYKKFDFYFILVNWKFLVKWMVFLENINFYNYLGRKI